MKQVTDIFRVTFRYLLRGDYEKSNSKVTVTEIYDKVYDLINDYDASVGNSLLTHARTREVRKRFKSERTPKSTH